MVDSTLSGTGIAAAAAIAGTDLFYVVQGAAGSRTSRRATGAQIATFAYASPTFTGTVTMPDGATWNNTRLSVNNSNVFGAVQITGSDTFGIATGALVVAGGGSFSTGLSVAGNGITTNYLNATTEVFTAALGLASGTQGIATDASNVVFFNSVVGGHVFFKALGSVFFENFLSAVPFFEVDQTGRIVLSNDTGAQTFILTTPTANAFQLGDFDAAGAPTAQTFGVQNVAAGTSNTAGADFIIAGSRGTGTGVGGAINLKVAPKGGSGTSQNALVTAIGVDNTGQVKLSQGFAVATLPTGIQGARAYVTDANATFTAGIGAVVAGGGANVVPVFFDGTNWRIG